jgi:hypothetical protein
VAPEIHHPGPKGITPGNVHVGEPAKQDKAESKQAETVLMDGGEHPTAGADASRGPLGLSDPGSVAMGKAAAEANQAPAKSASKAAWADYAVAQGMAREEADAATRADLIDRYGGS